MATAGDIMETGTGSAGVNPAANRPRFTWRYDHKLDAQGRVPLPAKWRPEDPSSLSLMAVMIKHPSEAEFVMVLPVEQFERFSNPICQGDFTDPLRLAERHDYVDRIIELELDSAGRISLPKEMRSAAALTDDVLFVGCIRGVEPGVLSDGSPFGTPSQEGPEPPKNMKLLALFNPRSWFSTGQPNPLSPLHRTSGLGGVPIGSVKALPETLARRFFSFENQRLPARNLIQGELQLPAVTPVRNDLVEDDVELVRRRRETRLLHETRPPGAGGTHDPELAVNRLRNRAPVTHRLVARD